VVREPAPWLSVYIQALTVLLPRAVEPKTELAGYKIYPLSKCTAWPFIPATKVALKLVVGAVAEMASLLVPSKVQCAFKFVAATSLELLYPPMGGSTGSELFFLQELIVTIDNTIAPANNSDRFFVTFFIVFVFIYLRIFTTRFKNV
jgi:hypothetical protein